MTRVIANMSMSLDGGVAAAVNPRMPAMISRPVAWQGC
jgi:hypothetical protein